MQVDLSGWSGEGDFTHAVLGALQQFEDIQFIRVEDAPASRAESGYSFISNELYVAFRRRTRRDSTRRFGVLPSSRTVSESALSLDAVGKALGSMEDIGGPDYADERMLQYLRTQRVIPPYQTRGYKLVEMVRIYEVSPEPSGERA